MGNGKKMNVGNSNRGILSQLAEPGESAASSNKDSLGEVNEDGGIGLSGVDFGVGGGGGGGGAGGGGGGGGGGASPSSLHQRARALSRASRGPSRGTADNRTENIIIRAQAQALAGGGASPRLLGLARFPAPSRAPSFNLQLLGAAQAAGAGAAGGGANNEENNENNNEENEENEEKKAKKDVEDYEKNVFDEFEDTPDLTSEYYKDLFEDGFFEEAPNGLLDNLIEALESLESIDEADENGENNRNVNVSVQQNPNVGRFYTALQNTEEKLIKLDSERSMKSSASNRSSQRSSRSVEESANSVKILADVMLLIGTGAGAGVGAAGASAEEGAANNGGAGAANNGGAGAAAAGNNGGAAALANNGVARLVNNGGAGAAGGAAAVEEKREVGSKVKTRSGREINPSNKYNREIVSQIIRQRKIKSKFKKAKPASKIISKASELSDMSALTATKAFLQAMKGSRIEGPDPDRQLKFIHGQDIFNSINEETPCDLCGFALKYRQPDDYYIVASPNYGVLKWSYDHTIPVNYAAAVLKIYFTNGQYSDQERQIMSFLGGPTCYHCNEEKSQQKFITCKNPKLNKWAELEPNEPAINTYLTRLIHSSRKGKNGKDADGITSLGRQINRIIVPRPGITKENYFIEIRTKYIKKKCKKICDLIQGFVDYDNAYARVKLMRSVIKAERAILEKVKPPLEKDVIKRRVSKKARDALFNCSVQPWIDGRVDLLTQTGVSFPFYSPKVTALKFTPEVAPQVAPQPAPQVAPQPAPQVAPQAAPARNRAAKSHRRKQIRRKTRKNLRSR